VKRKKDIASEFCISVSTLSTILKDKDKLLKAVPQWKRFRFKASSFPEIEHAMAKWMEQVRYYNLSISRPIIQEKAWQSLQGI